MTVTIGATTEVVENPQADKWNTQRISFTPDAVAQTLRFSGNATAGVFLDNVRISRQAQAPVALTPKLFYGIELSGEIGQTYRIEYKDDLPQSFWSFLTRKTLTDTAVTLYLDEIAPGAQKRFYRSVLEQ